jgi:hypothetical protein
LIKNQAILLWDEGSLQTYWLDGRRSAPVAGMLEAEIWALPQQINVLRRTAPKKLSFSTIDRLIFVGLYRLFPRVCDALAIVKPDTLVRWHRAGFRSYWCWKSKCRCGRPIVPLEIRRLVREMSIANPVCAENLIQDA